MSVSLVVTSEGGRVYRLDVSSGQATLLYQHPGGQELMGVVVVGNTIYLSGSTVLLKGTLQGDCVVVQQEREYFHHGRWMAKQLRNFWHRVGAYARVVEYVPQDFHQMNLVEGRLVVTATSRNEVWEVDKDLALLRRIVIQPHRHDYHHLNNVFWDGQWFYVCLNRYAQPFGVAGYAKFTKEWEEVERKTLGWESHALAIVQGQLWNLVASSSTHKPIAHPHKAGLMVDDTLVFEHDPDRVFCKDFSVDADRIYIVGGQIGVREMRKQAEGVVYVLDRQYRLQKEIRIAGTGGFRGCRLLGVDYSNGAG